MTASPLIHYSTHNSSGFTFTLIHYSTHQRKIYPLLYSHKKRQAPGVDEPPGRCTPADNGCALQCMCERE
jgi:hypothetical protein